MQNLHQKEPKHFPGQDTIYENRDMGANIWEQRPYLNMNLIRRNWSYYPQILEFPKFP